MNLIEKRNIARAENNFDHERILNREIKQWARYDRKQWLLGILDDDTWSSIKKHRRGFKPKLRRMRNMAGEPVESEQKAETIADYFEKKFNGNAPSRIFNRHQSR